MTIFLNPWLAKRNRHLTIENTVDDCFPVDVVSENTSSGNDKSPNSILPSVSFPSEIPCGRLPKKSLHIWLKSHASCCVSYSQNESLTLPILGHLRAMELHLVTQLFAKALAQSWIDSVQMGRISVSVNHRKALNLAKSPPNPTVLGFFNANVFLLKCLQVFGPFQPKIPLIPSLLADETKIQPCWDSLTMKSTQGHSKHSDALQASNKGRLPTTGTSENGD